MRKKLKAVRCWMSRWSDGSSEVTLNQLVAESFGRAGAKITPGTFTTDPPKRKRGRKSHPAATQEAKR